MNSKKSYSKVANHAPSNALPVKLYEEPVKVSQDDERGFKLGRKFSKAQDYSNSLNWTTVAYLAIFSFAVRLFFLNHPSVVVFDEVHFGGFATKYLKHDFFADLHPPLARLLITFSAWVGGFDTKFRFYDIGADYIKAGVPYVTMRAFTAICGSLVPLIAYLTLRIAGVSFLTSLVTSAVLIMENGLITQSKLILLDSYLVLFTAMIPLFYAFWQNQQNSPFSWRWHMSLFGLGVSMALAASCKWVGLFAIAAIGLFTISDLWKIFCNVSQPLTRFSKHFFYRTIYLIVIPFGIYAFTFWIHFSLLTNYTEDANGYPIEFRQGLRGGERPPTIEEVYYGSTIRLRHGNPNGPFLHSHSHVYPEGSKQQQVTGYHHADGNNLWIIRKPHVVNQTYVEGTEYIEEQSTLERLHHGDLIRLEHVGTGRFLHSHRIAPPLSNKEKQNEVSCYGSHKSKISDSNDNWRIEVVKNNGLSLNDGLEPEEQDKLEIPISATIKIRLVHVNTGGKLHTKGKALPKWAFGQHEITGGSETNRWNNIWRIDHNTHLLLDPSVAKMISYPTMNFWEKFIEQNMVMWASNAGLDDSHPYGSRPDSWPFVYRGLGFWNGNHVPQTERQYRQKKKKEAEKDPDAVDPGELADDEGDVDLTKDKIEAVDKVEQERLKKLYQRFKGQQVHLIGNPAVWWSSSAFIGVYVVALAVVRILQKRFPKQAANFRELPLGQQIGGETFAGFLFIQWVWHYLPFFGMGRQLFLHHYLPALYFAVLLMSVVLDSILKTVAAFNRRAGRWLQIFVMGSFLIVSAYLFYRLSPLCYGLTMSKGQCEALKWRAKWDFDCGSLADATISSVTSKAAVA